MYFVSCSKSLKNRKPLLVVDTKKTPILPVVGVDTRKKGWRRKTAQRPVYKESRSNFSSLVSPLVLEEDLGRTVRGRPWTTQRFTDSWKNQMTHKHVEFKGGRRGVVYVNPGFVVWLNVTK